MSQYENLGCMVRQMCRTYHQRQETFTTWLLTTAACLDLDVRSDGQLPMRALEELAGAVAAQLPASEIPVEIVDSLRDVVWLRKETNAAHLLSQAAGQQGDDETRRRNDSHVHAIGVFERILAILDASMPPLVQREAEARWQASRAEMVLKRHAEAAAATMASLQEAPMMYRGSWGEVHDNNVTLRRDSGICMEMTVEEDVAPQHFDYMQGQYHVPLENQAWSCAPWTTPDSDCWTTAEYVQDQYHMALENQAVSYPLANNYNGGNNCWATPECVQGESPYGRASSPNEAFRMFLESSRQTHSPDVLNDDREATPEFNGNDIIIDAISQATAWPAQSPDNTTPLIVHSNSWNH